MRRWYSREELNQINSLTKEGLTSREIAERLGRPEAGIRNVRYRLKMERRTKETIDSLIIRKNELESEINKLKQTRQKLFDEINSLTEKKRHYENQINIDRSLLKRKIEDRLRELKVEKPELFYISNEEQIMTLVGHLIKWFIF